MPSPRSRGKCIASDLDSVVFLRMRKAVTPHPRSGGTGLALSTKNGPGKGNRGTEQDSLGDDAGTGVRS
jgi:hypothetical protein